MSASLRRRSTPSPDPQAHGASWLSFTYQLVPKATPNPPGDPNIWRVRCDIVDRDGKISLRHSGHMLHLGIGRAHARIEIICLVHNDQATVMSADTGDVLTEHTLDPSRTCQRKNG